jgi:multidrug efflux pump subunit AcrB
MNVSAPFIKRPIATVLLMVALLVGGLVAHPLLPVLALQDINYPTVTVTAQLPGADPQTMASTVAAGAAVRRDPGPHSDDIGERGRLHPDHPAVRLEPQHDGAVSDTLSAIQTASAYLPKNIPYPPMIRKVNPADTPVLVLGISSDSLPITVVDAYAQNIS